MTEGAEAAALLARLVRCESPEAVLEALAAAGGRAVPPGRKTLYVRRGDAFDAYRAGAGAEDGTEVPEAEVRAVVRSGRRAVAGYGGRSVLLVPLESGGERLGALAVEAGPAGAARGTAAPPTGRGGGGLDLVADCCALALRAHSVRGPLADAVEAARAGVFAWDLTADDVYWDERTCTVFGVDPGTFDRSGETFFRRLHPDDVPAVQNAIAEVTASAAGAVRADGAAGAYRIGYRVVHGDGSVHRLTELGRVVPDERGRPVRALGLVYESGDGAPEAAPRAGGTRDAFLHTLTRALSRAVTVADVTRVLTDLARPALGAENLVLGVVEGGRLQIVGESRVAPGLPRLGAAAHEVMAEAAVRERPLFIEDLSGSWGAAAAGALPPRAWAVLSLGPVDRAPGACLISFARPRRFSAEERTFYTAVAVILAQSLERARLFDTQLQRATDLQQAMLPACLPALDALSARARYLPGTQGMQIGGDWYDALALGDGTAALVIGDVQGHDAHASAVMGQLRVALRACAEPGLAPGRVLGQVNRVLCDLDTDRFATCAYLVLSPADGVLRGARAGHPHPVRVGSGAVEELRLDGGPPLGVDPRAVYPTTADVLGGEDVLLLFTDGLVERRDADIDTCVRGMAEDVRRWRAAARGRAEDLDALVDFLAGREAPDRIDDVALLAVRRDGSATGRGVERPAGPTAAGA
ncbi:SpoIIE family protein phosphatase [Streptomyces sp. C10-9-1]|uniref:SpoIIE family protein phosphatase n=1 Tax=Streptomyces sp. C10-9-1 TaxID=1859285 RepID=UPI00211375A1|nr:SpoIIE family protein phosphatase [Streptomyces sp. C10-9-1]MCQ6553330.1 SpoIIE family protein phosphatase [Streptomyces sp. C10-9-1]